VNVNNAVPFQLAHFHMYVNPLVTLEEDEVRYIENILEVSPPPPPKIKIL